MLLDGGLVCAWDVLDGGFIDRLNSRSDPAVSFFGKNLPDVWKKFQRFYRGGKNLPPSACAFRYIDKRILTFHLFTVYSF